ncbi:DUF4314 domain-containing protein [Gardnerella sp. DNF01205]|uniref:DUF4314 domain-containing protein n=1 Tax=Gardnerella sp. DNF01205 TaxID=2749069 RepID=UPI003BA9BAA3
MMRTLSREQIEKLRKTYPKGCLVELILMDDVQAPPSGTKGRVLGVDDMGSIMVSWETGSRLSVVYGVDKCRKIGGL